MSLFHAGLTPALDADGSPLAGATWSFYVAGTDTPLTVYTDHSLTTPAGFSVSANSAGRFPPIYFNEANPTRAILRDAFGATITRADVDPINAGFSFTADTRTILSLIPALAGETAFLSEAGREGWFTRRSGDVPVADPQQGIYIAHAVTGYWERQWDKINGKPEWFGAVSGSQAGSIPASNLVAIYACINACPVTQLEAFDYHINSTLVFNTAFRTLRGPTPAWNATGKGTRVLSSNVTQDVIQVGSDGGGVSDMIVENICAMHSALLTAPAAGSEATAAKAWSVLRTTSVTLRGCSAFDPLIGFFFNRTVYTKLYDCRSYRSDDKSYPGDDFFYGFWAYDSGVHLNLAGGNGSLHLFACNVTGGSGLMSRGVGLYGNGDFADLFTHFFETSTTPAGIRLNGVGSSYSGGHGDVRLIETTIDNASWTGIEVASTNPLAKIEINGGYVQANDNGATSKGLYFHNGGGSITVSNLQVTGTPGGGATTSVGCRIENQPNVVLDDTTIIENFPFPCDVLGTSPRFRILCQLQAGETNSAGTRAALTLNGGTQGILEPTISGGANAWVTGINLNGTTNSGIKADLTMVDAGSINSARRMTINGIPVTTPGYYDPDGTSGTAGQGINVTGIMG